MLIIVSLRSMFYLRQKGFTTPAILWIVLIILAITGFFVAGFIKQTDVKNAEPSLSEVNLPISSSPTPVPFSTPTPKPSLVSVTPTQKPTLMPVVKPLPTSLEIKGDEDCLKRTNEALNLIKEKAESHYNEVKKYIGIIECTERQSGMAAYENPPRFQVGRSTYQSDTIWYAGTIVHDAHHSKLYHDYLQNHPSEITVPYEAWGGRDSEQRCIDVQLDALQKIGADQYILDYVKDSINTEYWNVPYEDRWW